MSLLNLFITELVDHLSRSSCQSAKLIKYHETGEFDFSFLLSMEIWKNFIKDLDSEVIRKYQNNILLFSTGDPSVDVSCAIERLRNSSASWRFPIEDVQVKDNHCCFTINRSKSYSKLLCEITSNYGKSEKSDEETISLCVAQPEDLSISSYRAELVKNVITNLVPYSRFTLVDDPSIAKYRIVVTTKSNLRKSEDNSSTILICGVVIDSETKKISTMNAHDYISKRCQDMHLISIHKYGVRVKNDEKFLELVERLGQYAATLDLLEVKQSSALNLQADPKQAFVLYNSARLQTLMEKFERQVTEGYYEKLQDIKDIDTSLLKEEEEWAMFKLLLTFPEVISQAINELDQGKASLHLIHKFLTSLANTFSIYYRRVRLLTENRAQLMPVLFAKIHLLKTIQKIFNLTLAILNIEPIAFM